MRSDAGASRLFEACARALTFAAGAVVICLPFLFALNPFRLSSAWLVDEQFLAVELSAALVFFFARRASVTETRAAQVVQIAAAIGAIAVGAAIFIHYSGDSMLFLQATPRLLAISGVLLALCLTASRFHGGWQMLGMVLAFLLFGYFSQFASGMFATAEVTLGRYLVYMTFGGDGLLGRALRIISQTVTIFVVFGIVYETSGGSDTIAALAMRAARAGRGSAIKVTVLASGLFGTISGSATSNVLTSGSFSIPGMRRIGVPAATAGGIEAVASTCGQIMPPVMGAAAFLMADLTAIPYGTIAISAAVPAIICYAVLFQQSGRLGQRIEARSDRDTSVEALDPARFRLSWASLLHAVPAIGIIWVLMRNDSNSEGAGMLGTALALAVALLLRGPSLTLKGILQVAPRAAQTVSNLVIAGATLGVVLAVMSSTGLDVKGALAISHVGESSLLLSLLMTAAAAFILGMGMSTSGVYLITGTLLAPGLVKLGVPLIAAHFFVLYCGMLSMITPPVAFAALAASGLVGASFRATAFEAMKFGWILFLLPFLMAYAPGLLLVGSPFEIVVDIASAAALVLALSSYPTGRGPVWAPLAGAVLILVAGLACFPILPTDAARAALACLSAAGAVWLARFHDTAVPVS